MALRRSEVDGRCGYAGLQHCGSVWSCPVCASSILMHRALEIGSMLGEALDQGYSLGFVTLTMRHRKGQGLRALWEAAGKAWGRSTSGKQWVASQAAEGVLGWVRVWEVTEGRNGWHVHVHAVVIFCEGAGEAELDAVAGGMFDRWKRGLVAAGLDAPLRRGQEWHLVSGETAAEEVGEYLFKMASSVDQPTALGLELTHVRPGRSRDDLKTRPVWALLDDLQETGEIGRWREWEAASKGKRQVSFSKGFRQRFAPAIEELSDEEIAAQERGSADDDLLRFTSDAWSDLVRLPGRILELLEATERGSLAGARRLLDRWGVDYSIV